MMPKIIILSLIILAGVIFAYLPLRRELLYRLNLSGDQTTSCCKEEEVLVATGEFEETASLAIFNSQIVDYPKTSLAQNNAIPLVEPAILGTTSASGEEKWIEVSLKEQKLRAWEGNKIVMEFLISSGKWAPTPVGTFYIWHKTRNQRMRGGSKELGTYYNLPNVPNNMFFYKGYAIHGAYWHNNFGQPMSHGCVNAPLAQAAQLFEWTDPTPPPGQNMAHASSNNQGTKVFVH